MSTATTSQGPHASEAEPSAAESKVRPKTLARPVPVQVGAGRRMSEEREVADRAAKELIAGAIRVGGANPAAIAYVLGVSATWVRARLDPDVRTAWTVRDLMVLRRRAPSVLKAAGLALVHLAEESRPLRLTLPVHGCRIAKEGGEASGKLADPQASRDDRRRELLEARDAIDAALLELDAEAR